MKTISLLITVLFFFLHPCPVLAQPKGEPYTCFFSTEPIRIDGLFNEKAWQNAKKLDFIIPVTYTSPISRTEAKLLWDKKYLYIAFKAYDKDIWAYYEKRDDPTCKDDVLEVFFKPDPESEIYYNFEINALNTIYDALNLGQQVAGGSQHWRKWNCAGLKSEIKIKGTLNRWNTDKEKHLIHLLCDENFSDNKKYCLSLVDDEYWSMEIAIPFSSLPALKGKSPNSGDKWLFHLCRCNYSVQLPNGREFSSCAPLSKANFHWYEDWIFLIFKKES